MVTPLPAVLFWLYVKFKSRSLPVNLSTDEILPRPQGASVLSGIGQKSASLVG